MNREEIDIAITSLVSSYVRAKKNLETVTHEGKKDILEDEIEVLSSILIRLERAKESDLHAGG
ncbi:MAG: hypothetical protein GPJ54_02345 [Candidatus Heimdallarchaeota archaeon]|nr:hypothetical protein [Candidatus Heimdallarchaeota archaeon]